MAKVYGVSFTTLLAPSPPRRRGLPTDFRTIGGAEPRLSTETVGIIREVQYQQDLIATLMTELDDAPAPDLRRAGLQDDPERIAARERAALGITDAEQLAWGTASDALRAWRWSVEAAGAFVFTRPLPRSECRGFSILDDAPTPVITISSREVDQAKLFTLLHEYGHLLLRRPGLCDEKEARRAGTEWFCNQFAAAALMPPSIVERVAMELRLVRNQWNSDALRLIARRLKVSRPAVTLRLEALGLADAGLYDALATDWEEDSWFTGGGGPVQISTQTLNRFGDRYVGLVLEALDRGLMDHSGFDEFLHVRAVHLDEVRGHYYDRRNPRAAAG